MTETDKMSLYYFTKDNSSGELDRTGGKINVRNRNKSTGFYITGS